MSEPESDEIRVDIWLWRARFFKTRAMATDYVARRGIRLTRFGQTRKTSKPGMHLLPGDVLTFYAAKTLKTIEFLAPGTRRGPATEAQTLYRSAGQDEKD